MTTPHTAETLAMDLSLSTALNVRQAAAMLRSQAQEIERLRKAAQQAMEALEAECGGRCNAENNPCHAALAAAECRKELK